MNRPNVRILIYGCVCLSYVNVLQFLYHLVCVCLQEDKPPEQKDEKEQPQKEDENKEVKKEEEKKEEETKPGKMSVNVFY